jgi:tetratricopeptide (TPR) repeat protein
MKAEHRKELQTNVLADTAGRFLQRIKEGPSRGTVLTCGAVALVLLIFFSWRYFSRTALESRSALWLKVDEAERKLDGVADLGQAEDVVKELEHAAQEKPQTVPAQVLRFTSARAQLRLGLERLCAQDKAEREKALNRIEQARDLFTTLVRETGETPILHQEALLGVATAQESLGQIDDALEEYRKVVAVDANSAAGKAAQARVEYLGDPEHLKQATSFYATLEQRAKK